ncbi:MAG: TIGR00730 family Rossman fold protein [Ruminococcaceae bacterium]|nr:TIGR00730 family Rossman fold protein [Oscillospiraceae bacterium]
MNICVFGAASVLIDKKYIDAVEEMGEHLAKNGHDLVFGSGSTGLMGAAARGFRKGGGKTHGVIPEFFKEDLSEFVDFNCDKMTYTESMRERKAVMEDAADAFIITPGGIGTFEEFFEVLTLKQLGRHRKPIVIYNIDGYYDNMIAAMEHSMEEGFIKETCKSLYSVFNDLDGMIHYIENDDMNGMTLHDFK